MPGLLDFLNDPQTAGLLGGAGAILNASGPSLMPHSFGQVLGAGLQGMQQGQQQALEQAFNTLKLQGAQGTLEDQQRARTQAEALRQFYLKRATAAQAPGRQQAAQPAPDQPADVMPGGPMSPKIGGPDWMQAYQASLPQQPFSAPQTVPPGMQSTPSTSIYQQRMTEAQDLRNAGFHAQADAAEAAALKFKPEFSTDPRVGVGPDGKPFSYVLDKDGNRRVLDGVLPRDKMELANLGGQDVAYNPYALQPGQSFKRTQSPDSAASNGLGWARLNWDKSQADGNDAGPLSRGAIVNAAARYNVDGTLPPMGMGKAGSQGRAAILNEAAEQAAGITGDQQRVQQLGNKANAAALTKLQQQQTMVGAFEKNFNSNADIVLEYSAKVDRTGVPILNKWINAGKRAVWGDPDLSAYDQAIKSAVNEYAKIVSGSMGNTAVAEGEIKKVEGLMNAAQTPQQVTAVINLMKRETQNRMKGFDDEKASLRAGMGGAPTQHAASAPAAGKVATLSDIAATAKASGRSTAEVTAALRAKGYTIGGQ